MPEEIRPTDEEFDRLRAERLRMSEAWAAAIHTNRPIVIDSLTELQQRIMLEFDPNAPRQFAPPDADQPSLAPPPVLCYECQSEGIIEIHDSWTYCECPAGVEQERRAAAEMEAVLRERAEQELANVDPALVRDFNRRMDATMLGIPLPGVAEPPRPEQPDPFDLLRYMRVDPTVPRGQVGIREPDGTTTYHPIVSADISIAPPSSVSRQPVTAGLVPVCQRCGSDEGTDLDYSGCSDCRDEVRHYVGVDPGLAPGTYTVVPVTTHVDRDGVVHSEYRVTGRE